jgi:flagellar biosynthesis protein FlhF
MRLKSFHARTMKDAMQLVKDTLGEDAVIISTHDEDGGGVSVTAAIEEDLKQADRLPPNNKNSYDNQQDWIEEDDDDLDAEQAVIEHLTEVLLKHGAPSDITDHILSCATIIGASEPRQALLAAIEHLYAYRPLPVKPYKKPIMVVGAPGAGKTLAIAKLATRAVMNGLNVEVITTDTIRAGGVEQLAAFTKILKAPLHKAKDAGELKSILTSLEDADQILIDTPGINPFDQEDIKLIARMITAGAIDPILVLPAGADAIESGEVGRIFATLGIRWVLPTRLDIARRFGGLLEAAHQGGFSFADASDTSKVADGLVPLTPERITELLMPISKRSEKVNKSLTSSRQTVKNQRK